MRRAASIAAAALVVAASPAAAAGAGAGGGLPACASAPCPSDHGPVVVLSYYDSRDFTRLVRAVKHSGLPSQTPIYYGNYWGAGKPSRPAPPHRRPPPAMPNRRYAPILPIGYSVFWHGRTLGPSARRVLAAHGQRRLSGRLPHLEHLLHRTAHFRYQAGLELGRRFRDRIRTRRAGGQRVVTWQFDELPSEIAGRHGAALRTFLRGVLRGVAFGRPVLGDRWLPGIVFATPSALGVRDGRFWRAVDSASLYLVGEEYPAFVGPPVRAARRCASVAARLPLELRRKYVAGMTPGHHFVPGLGGNVRHRGRRAVDSWRSAYVRARARRGIAGFAQWNFRYGNSGAAVMNDVLRALARGVRTRLAR